MPLSTEMVPRSPLSGKELTQCVLESLRLALEGDPYLRGMVGFGRAGWKIRVDIQTGTTGYPEHWVLAKGGDALPLDGETQGDIIRLDVMDGFDAPNLARVQNGLPILVTRREGDQIVQTALGVDVRDVDPRPLPQVVDLSGEAARELGRTFPNALKELIQEEKVVDVGTNVDLGPSGGLVETNSPGAGGSKHPPGAPAGVGTPGKPGSTPQPPAPGTKKP